MPTFLAAVQNDTKVMLTFSEAMRADAVFLSPLSYTVTDLDGNTTLVASVVVSGLPTPVTKATLTLASPLDRGGYYAITVDAAVHTMGGQSMDPDTVVFQWEYVESFVGSSRPLVIPLDQFSGEVSSGILGQPAGLLWFSPALDVAAANSVIQIDDISCCTYAFDSYVFPQPIDPPALFIFSPSGPVSSIGSSTILWAPAERLGLARVELSDARLDTLLQPVSGPGDATLVEPIDITKAGFLNDARWHLFDGSPTTFIVADNLVPIGPGPTININLEP